VAGRLVFPGGERKPLDPRYEASSLPWLYIRFDQDWGIRDVESAPGGNMSFRRALIRQLGGFDENFIGNAFREETDFCLRLRTTGHRIRFDPEAAVLHHFGTPGGCDNIRLGTTADPSARYYHDFARNNMYCFCKHVPASLIPGVVWDLYRAHVGNRAVLRRGVRFWWQRHAAFLRGMRDGIRTWQRHRRPARKTV
jgi:GT2 family glycosyltransferase